MKASSTDFDSQTLDLDAHLARVSRSFAFCIARLEAPLNRQVGLSYLICRILDSIEDAKWKDRRQQNLAFSDFLQFLKSEKSEFDPVAIKEWSDRVIDGTELPHHEVLLMRDANKVFHALATERPRVRDAMIRPIESMARGMMEYGEVSSGSSMNMKLGTLGDVNRYCFFVAGVVGEILNGLLKLFGEDRGVMVRTSLVEGFRFGLFLQKVNLLKDREQDLVEGRDLVPSKILVFQSAFQDAKKAFSYLSSVPMIFESYRLFCGWSLFLGLASLPHIASGRKIGRLETLALLASVESRVNSNVDLEKLFEKYLEEASGVLEKTSEGDADREQQELSKIAASGETEKLKFVDSYRRHYVGVANDSELLQLAEEKLS